MFRVKQNGNTVADSDSLVYIRMSGNGSYVPCDREKADGFCVKTPYTQTNEETGETFAAVRDVVYALRDGGLTGVEPVATVEAVNGALAVAEATDRVYDELCELCGIQGLEEYGISNREYVTELIRSQHTAFANELAALKTMKEEEG